MKLVTKIAINSYISFFHVRWCELNWGNTYSDANAMTAASSFGVHFDVNDNTTVGWEGGLMVGLSWSCWFYFPFRLRCYSYIRYVLYLVGRCWNWMGNCLSTAIDYEMVGNNDFDITVNLGFGF